MPRSPRVNVSLKPEHYEVLRRLAAANGSSMSSIMAETWDLAAPVLARVANLLEEAQAAQESVREGIREATAAAALEIAPQAEKVLLTFDLFEQAIRDVVTEARGIGDGGATAIAAGDDSRGAPAIPPSSNTGVRSTRSRGVRS